MSVTMRFPCFGGGPDCPVPPMQAVFMGAEPTALPCLHCHWHTHTIEAESPDEARRIWRERVLGWPRPFEAAR